MPLDQQRLVYEGRQLVDSRSLKGYNVGKGSELQLIFSLCGGNNGSGMRFVDISNSNNLQVLPWAKTSPDWLIAEPGLCIEGCCHNPSCAAYCETVVCNQGMGTFDLLVDAGHVTCPICNEHVKPQTCAFNNCQWRYSGIKARSPSRLLRSLDWASAGDQYELFSGEAVSRVKWHRLLISTRQQQPEETGSAECGICQGRVGDSQADPQMTTRCGHKYHISCIEAWKKMGKGSCPKCMRSL